MDSQSRENSTDTQTMIDRREDVGTQLSEEENERERKKGKRVKRR